MSFIKQNEYFLRYGLESKLKGLAIAERGRVYQLEFQSEARQRIHKAYAETNGHLPDKVELYKNLLFAFGGLEKGLIINSIYFERQSDILFRLLKEDIKRHIDVSDNILISLIEGTVQQHDNSSTKGLLKAFFTQNLDLNSGDWETEDEKQNPVINALTIWFRDHLTKDDPNIVTQVILHYSKLWDIYFGDPFKYLKGLILVHKLLDQYKRTDSTKIKINLYGLMNSAHLLLSDLLPTVVQSPITDIDNSSFLAAAEKYSFPEQAKNYLKKSQELYQCLQDDAILFTDINKLSWNSLVDGILRGSANTKKLYLDEIKKRQLTGSPPLAQEILDFVKKYSDRNHLISEKSIGVRAIEIENYIFYT